MHSISHPPMKEFHWHAMTTSLCFMTLGPQLRGIPLILPSHGELEGLVETL
jgi:hypothetical protein